MVTSKRKSADAQRKAQTRARLLDAAAVEFARNGYHATLISDIVSTAAVGQGTFYRFFDGKRRVLEALFERLASTLLTEFQPLSERPPTDLVSYRAASRAVGLRLAEVLERNRDLVRLFLREGAAVDREFEGRVRAIGDHIADLARGYLEHAIAGGFARPCRADLVSQALVGMAMRLLDHWLAGELTEPPIEVAVDELVEFAFRGFGPVQTGADPTEEVRDG